MSSLYGSKKQGYKLANLDENKMGTNQAGQALPLFWGVRELGLKFITPLWNSVVRPVKKKYSAGGVFGSKSKTVTVGYDRYSAICGAVCVGPVDKLLKIRYNDEVVWEGNSSIVNAGPPGYSSFTTADGVIRFYWGKGTQTPDTILRANWPDMPAFPHWCYVVCDRFYFGQSTSPPSIRFTMQRKPEGFTGAYIGYDACLAEVLYDVLSNTIYGMGISAARLNKASFEACATRLRTEGLGFSPLLTSATDLRQFVSQATALIRGRLIWKDGKLELRLERDDDTLAMTVGTDHMTDEPTIHRGGWPDTFTETQLTFPSRELNFEDDFVSYRDAANFNVTGTYTRQEVQHDWITNKATATALVKVEGQDKAVPGGSISLRLTAECRHLHPGDYLSVEYPPLAITGALARVKSVQIGNPKDPVVDVEAELDRLNVSKEPYVPEQDPYVPPTIPQTQDVILRIGWLPDSLKGEFADGFFACVARPNDYTTAAVLSLSMDGTNYFQVGTPGTIGFAANITRWRTFGTRALIRLELVSANSDEDILVQLLENYSEVSIVCGAVSNGAEIPTGAWLRYPYGGYLQKVAAKTWDMEVERAVSDTQELQLANPRTGSPAFEPGLWAFGGPESAMLFPSDELTFEAAGAVRKVKAQAVTLYETQALVDAAMATSTQSASGSKFDPAWSVGLNPVENQEYAKAALAGIGYWRLAGNALDAVNAHDGTPSGVVFDGGPAITGGISSARFGAGASLTVPEWEGARPIEGSAGDCWFQSQGAGTGLRGIFGKLGDWLICSKNGFFAFADYGADTLRVSTVPIGTAWHHLCLMFTSAGATRRAALYVDGVQAIEGPCVKLSDGDLCFGANVMTLAGEAIGGAVGLIGEASIGQSYDPATRYNTGVNVWWD